MRASAVATAAVVGSLAWSHSEVEDGRADFQFLYGPPVGVACLLILLATTVSVARTG